MNRERTQEHRGHIVVLVLPSGNVFCIRLLNINKLTSLSGCENHGTFRLMKCHPTPLGRAVKLARMASWSERLHVHRLNLATKTENA